VIEGRTARIEVGMSDRKTWWRNFMTEHPVRLPLSGRPANVKMRPDMPTVGSARAACRSVGVCPKTETHSTSSECRSTVQTQRPWPRST
jgi:hypothetical protein